MSLESDTPKVRDLRCLTPESKFLKLFVAEWEDSHASGVWAFASRKATPKMICSTDEPQPDAVIIVPVVEIDGIEYLVLVREFRFPLNDHIYAFPAGLIDNGETLERAATRELQEEVGYRVKNILHISPPIYSSAGLTDESVVMVFVECEVGGSTNHDQAEYIEPLLFTPDMICALLERESPFERAKVDAKCWAWLHSSFGDISRKQGPAL